MTRPLLPVTQCHSYCTDCCESTDTSSDVLLHIVAKEADRKHAEHAEAGSLRGGVCSGLPLWGNGSGTV